MLPNEDAPSEGGKTTDNSDLKALEKTIAEATGLRVSIQPGAGEKGKITFNYKTLDQFEELCRKLGAQF
jgi:ParB family chromosome partitioning protein